VGKKKSFNIDSLLTHQPRRGWIWIAFQAKVSATETFAWKGATCGKGIKYVPTPKGLNVHKWVNKSLFETHNERLVSSFRDDYKPSSKMLKDLCVPTYNPWAFGRTKKLDHRVLGINGIFLVCQTVISDKCKWAVVQTLVWQSAVVQTLVWQSYKRQSSKLTNGRAKECLALPSPTTNAGQWIAYYKLCQLTTIKRGINRAMSWNCLNYYAIWPTIDGHIKRGINRAMSWNCLNYYAIWPTICVSDNRLLQTLQTERRWIAYYKLPGNCSLDNYW